MIEPTTLEQALLTSPVPEWAHSLPNHFVFPRYQGRSGLNLPPTIGTLLGITEGWNSPALDPSLWQSLADGVQRVMFLLVDGIGWRRLWHTLRRFDDAFVPQLEQRGALIHPITTISPATTSVATTTLWCDGSPPAQHGMLGYTFLVSDYSAVLNMLFWRPAATDGDMGTILSWGIEPETFLSVPSIAQRLAEDGVSTTSITPDYIVNSPLSRMQQRDARKVGYLNATDMWLKMRQWLTDTRDQRAYATAYYPDFDTFSHRDGPDAPSWDALWREFRFHFTAFLEGVPADDRRNTLFLISADHGHVHSPLEQQTFLSDHPDFTRLFSVQPGGEPRHAYLYVRPGRVEDIKAYHAAHLATDFHLIASEEALRGGLYGSPATVHPDADRRIGDFVLLSRGGATIWPKPREKLPVGMHGSLEPEEMIVPLMALRLDA